MTQAEINRRAGGRRRINAERQAKAMLRQLAILDRIGFDSILLATARRSGLQTNLADVFGVHRSTICRDFEAILEQWRRPRRCPRCREVIIVRGGHTLKALTRAAKQGLWDGCTLKRCEIMERRERRVAKEEAQLRVRLIELRDAMAQP